MTCKHELADVEAVLQIMRELERKGYKVKNIREIEAEVKRLRNNGQD